MAQSTLTTRRSIRAAAAEGSGRRRADIQGLRAIAVTVVVLFHAGLTIPGGFVGVDVFFVISGFVISRMLLREFQTTGSIHFRRFFGKRFRRLTPALALVLFVTLIASALLQSPMGEQKTTAATALGGIALAANAVIFRATGGYFEPAAEVNPLLHIWSLSVEEQFYVVFPFFLLGVLALGRRLTWGRGLPIAGVAAITALSAGLAMVVAAGWELPLHPFLTSYYSPLTRAWEFGAGVLVAIIPTLLKPRSRNTAIAASTAGLGLLAASMYVISDATPFPGPATLLPVLGTALLLHGGGHALNPLSRALGARPFVWVGDLSYSWYLWHWPMIVFASIIFPGSLLAKASAAFLALLPAVISYRYVEQPIRDMNGLSKVGFIRVAAIVVAPAILLSGLVLVGSAKGWGLEKVQSIQAMHPGWSKCMSFATMPNGPAANPGYSDCRWNDASSGRAVYLVGDSNASQFSGPLIQASQEADRPFSMRTAGGCPFLDVFRQVGDTFDGPDQLCRDYYESTLAWLTAEEGGTVVIASTEGYWFEKNMAIGANLNSVQASPSSRSEALETGMGRTVSALQDAGHQVVLVQALPHPTFAGYKDVPGRCSVIALATSNCNLTVPRSVIDAVQLPARTAIKEVASATGANVLDLSDSFCDKSQCSMNKDNDLLYQDPLHITVNTARSLTPYFAQALGDASTH